MIQFERKPIAKGVFTCDLETTTHSLIAQNIIYPSFID
jgi:hypothetical protein